MEAHMGGRGRGSNRAQWDAMDLHTAPTQRRPMPASASASSTTSASTSAGAAPPMPMAACASSYRGLASNASRREDDARLSATNQLLQRKLFERRRYDSADDAMHKFDVEKARQGQSGGMPSSSTNATPTTMLPGAAALVRATSEPVRSDPVQMGAALYSSALRDGSSDPRPTGTAAASTASVSMNVRVNVNVNAATAPAVPPAQSTSRYGALANPSSASEALSACNILIQKKLQEKKVFDSADYQLERYKRMRGRTRRSTAAATSSMPLTEDESDVSTAPSSPMETDRAGSPSELDDVAAVSSPIATDVATRRMRSQQAQMSPATRGGATNKYGNLGAGSSASASQTLCRRLMAGSRSPSPGVPEAMRSPPPPPTLEMESASPPAAPQFSAALAPAPAQAPAARSSKYGQLCAANVMMRRQLKERKWFDSGEYFMEREREQKQQRRSLGAVAHSTNANTASETVDDPMLQADANSPRYPMQMQMQSSHGTAAALPDEARPVWRIKAQTRPPQQQ